MYHARHLTLKEIISCSDQSNFRGYSGHKISPFGSKGLSSNPSTKKDNRCTSLSHSCSQYSLSYLKMTEFFVQQLAWHYISIWMMIQNTILLQKQALDALYDAAHGRLWYRQPWSGIWLQMFHAIWGLVLIPFEMQRCLEELCQHAQLSGERGKACL